MLAISALKGRGNHLLNRRSWRSRHGRSARQALWTSEDAMPDLYSISTYHRLFVDSYGDRAIVRTVLNGIANSW